MRRRRTCATCLTVLWIGLLVGATPGLLHAEGSVAGGELIRLNDDGGWCWFQGERAIVHDGRLLVGSVAAGAHDPERKGDVELTVYDPADDRARRITLHEGLGLDDHNTPALLARQDGRLLAVWAAHGSENRFYYRLTTGEGPVHWGERRRFIPSESSRITYSNVFQLGEEDGRVYNFYRGLDDSFKPSYAYSDDGGRSWNSGSIVIDVPTEFRHRPYVKYASNGTDAIHLLYTEGHPRKYDNSVYHVVYRAGKLRSSDGKPLAPLSEGLDRPEEGTRVFEGDADRVAWTSDLHLDAEGRPYAAFSVQVGDGGKPQGEHGEDHRYYYARWDGGNWHAEEIAYAGTRLYPGENDYTGLIALDPDDPGTVYISTDAHPRTGEPLTSDADGQRHYEIYRGRRDEAGEWSWTPITRGSEVDNLRPIVPAWNERRTALLWLRGEYRTYRDYDLDVVGLIDPDPSE